MILSYLFLAHLLGDFVFQPSSLVLYKMRSVFGVLLHVMIHFTLNILILLPFLLNGYLWLLWVILIICFLHFWIDQAKISYDLRHDKKVKPFIIDQLLHLLTILLAYFFVSSISFILPDTAFSRIYLNANLVTYFSLLVFISAVIEVYNFQKRREHGAKVQLKMDARQMLFRITIFTVFYGIFVGLGIFAQIQN